MGSVPVGHAWLQIVVKQTVSRSLGSRIRASAVQRSWSRSVALGETVSAVRLGQVWPRDCLVALGETVSAVRLERVWPRDCLVVRQWGGLDECQSCAMEQVLILALGAFPAAVQTNIVVSKRVASDPGRALGNNDLDKEDIAGLMLCIQQYRSR
jgi:hypothetical protein